MNRKERRKELQKPHRHGKFLYSEKQELPVRFETKEDGRTTAYVTVEGYASTKVKDGSGDIVIPEGIDLSRFEAGNAPLKCMHGRSVLSNVGVILSANVNSMGLYIKAEARLDLSKDSTGNYINKEDYTLYDRLMNRTINGFSIGFHNIKEGWDDELKANIIHSLTLHEISLVDVPDNSLTIVKAIELYRNLSSDTDMTETTENMEIETEEVSTDSTETLEEEIEEEVQPEEKELDTTEEQETESQEQEVIGNDDGETPEQGDAGEGEKILAGTKDLETQAKAIGDLQNKVKELEDQNAELAIENGQLQADLEEAAKMFDEVLEDNKALRVKINKVLALKSIKVEHGLKQVEAQEVKKGNVAVAMEEAFKQL